jgi:hypothetical protein
MRQFLTGWVAALSVAVGSLAMTGTSTGAVVSLSANTGLNTPISGGFSEEVSFALPADVATINGFTISFSYADGSTTTPSFGVGSLEVLLFQTPATLGASIFIAGGVYNISPSATSTAASFTSNVGDSSATSIDPAFAFYYTLDPLSATGLWGLSAGSAFSFYFSNTTTSPTSVTPKILSATLLLDYNTPGGGAVPEPSTLAIALVGLAGWRGRRMLRRC